jgi:hypothetical protein
MCQWRIFYSMEGSGPETVPQTEEDQSLEKTSSGLEHPPVPELYDEPEDLNTQTVIQNRYCFWCHRRGGKASVS